MFPDPTNPCPVQKMFALELVGSGNKTTHDCKYISALFHVLIMIFRVGYLRIYTQFGMIAEATADG